MRWSTRLFVAATLTVLLALGPLACTPRSAQFLAGAVIFTAAAASIAQRKVEVHHHHHHHEPPGVIVYEHDHRIGPLRYVDPETGQVYIYEE